MNLRVCSGNFNKVISFHLLLNSCCLHFLHYVMCNVKEALGGLAADTTLPSLGVVPVDTESEAAARNHAITD